MNSHEVFIHIHQGCFAGTGAIVRLPQCQWSKPDGYGKIGQCITTSKHIKAPSICYWDLATKSPDWRFNIMIASYLQNRFIFTSRYDITIAKALLFYENNGIGIAANTLEWVLTDWRPNKMTAIWDTGYANGVSPYRGLCIVSYFIGIRRSIHRKSLSHWVHWWRQLQPTASVITDAKSADLNLDDFARKMPGSAWKFT